MIKFNIIESCAAKEKDSSVKGEFNEQCKGENFDMLS